VWLRRLAPSVDGDPREIAWVARVMRASGTPVESRRFTVVSAEMDVREILQVVRVPTLVLDRRHAASPKGGIDMPPLEEAEYVAARIPGAELKVLEGRDYLPWIGDADAIVAETSRFATGSVEVRDHDRVLLTVLFTDIVGSTEHLARLGDRDWHHLLGLHDEIASAAIERFRGRQVDQAGDGIFATFDGPARAIGCAQEMVDRVSAHGLELRAGVHTGECELDGERVTGIAVHIGARVAAQAAPGEILASRVVTELVAGSGLGFVDRGTTQLKGIPGDWQLFAVA
jgi:class 3 adenylate cyclase